MTRYTVELTGDLSADQIRKVLLRGGIKPSAIESVEKE